MAEKKDSNADDERPEQTPDQFTALAPEPNTEIGDVPKNHATKGMTTLGYTQASRIENSHLLQQEEQAAAEKAAAKEK